MLSLQVEIFRAGSVTMIVTNTEEKRSFGNSEIAGTYATMESFNGLRYDEEGAPSLTSYEQLACERECCGFLRPLTCYDSATLDVFRRGGLVSADLSIRILKKKHTVAKRVARILQGKILHDEAFNFAGRHPLGHALARALALVALHTTCMHALHSYFEVRNFRCWEKKHKLQNLEFLHICDHVKILSCGDLR